MGNKASAQEAKGAGKDVIKQTQKSSNELYEYVDLNGGGKLVEAFRRGEARKDFTEVEELIDGFRGKFLYNDGVGKDIEVKELVQWRNQSRDVQEPKEKSIFSSFFTTFTNRVEDTIETVGTDNYALTENTGESALHMAIVNENQEMVHYLCKHGANIHERAYGAFLMPEDQRKSRRDNFTQEEIVLSDVTNYESNTYWGEYPLSFAAGLGLEDMVRYLLARGACPNKQDTNGNTVLHIMVIHDKLDMYDLILDIGCRCPCQCSKPLTDIVNRMGFTPLTLAAKLARKEMFHHILTREREVFWQYGEVTCAAFSLNNLDTVSSELGHINEKCALNIITHEESVPHLDLFDGILYNLLKEKWKYACRYRFDTKDNVNVGKGIGHHSTLAFH